MKTLKINNTTIIFLILFFPYSRFFAQQIDIENKYKSGTSEISGAHYKDNNSVFNNFEGDWLYSLVNSDGTTTSLYLKIKKVNDIPDTFGPSNIHYFTDALLVAHRFVKNNIVKFDNLNGFNQLNSLNATNFYGDYILDPNNKPVCSTCGANEKRVQLFYSEPNNNDYYYNIVLRRTTNSNNVPILEMKVYAHSVSMITPDNPVKKDMDLAVGNYVLIKQQ
jgi:hypothetical protein